MSLYSVLIISVSYVPVFFVKFSPFPVQSKFGEAQAKEQKAKQAQLAKAKAAPDINPNLIEVSERVITKEKPKEPIPEIEWW